MHILSNEEKVKWIEDYADRETAVGRKQVQDAETASMKEKDDIRNAEMVGLTTRKLERTFSDMFNAIGDTLSDRASSINEEDGEGNGDDEADSDLHKLSEDDKPHWVIGIISKIVEHHMESYWQKHMRVDELRQPGWGNTADHCRERDMK